MWKILLSLSHPSVLTWVLDWEALWLVEMNTHLELVFAWLMYVPNCVCSAGEAQQFLGAVRLITHSKPAPCLCLWLPASLDVPVRLCYQVQACVFLKCTFNSLVYSVTWKLSYTLKICLALQGGIFVLNREPKPASSLWKTRLDVQLLSSWLHFSDGKMVLVLYFSTIISDSLGWKAVKPWVAINYINLHDRIDAHFALQKYLGRDVLFFFHTSLHCIGEDLVHFLISFAKLGVWI